MAKGAPESSCRIHPSARPATTAKEVFSVTAAQLGKKRTCPSCNGRFYDLMKSPAECPYCETVFNPEELVRTKRVKPSAAVAEVEKKKKKVAPLVEDEEDDLADVEVDDDADEAEEDEVDSDVIEDTSDLGEDDDDMAEVMDNVDRKNGE
jgi:uncharacterized protein (TIGR02300 family)